MQINCFVFHVPAPLFSRKTIIMIIFLHNFVTLQYVGDDNNFSNCVTGTISLALQL